ncbi:hypothetical protein QJS66_22540 [Kocuria rhizophila]|nr:hypothetical protein QJS66_22540 [Kocuria rhizophila]
MDRELRLRAAASTSDGPQGHAARPRTTRRIPDQPRQRRDDRAGRSGVGRRRASRAPARTRRLPGLRDDNPAVRSMTRSAGDDPGRQITRSLGTSRRRR